MGVDWHRKGGDIAYRVTKELVKRGVKATLSVVGCKPLVNEPLPVYVRNYGFVNKATERGSGLIDALLRTSHFLIVPSMAESFGAVFAEASSFGTPSISRNVGGIPNAVRDGVNGKLFDSDAEISEYCNYIMSTLATKEKYRELSLSSFREFQNRLNWNNSAERIFNICSASSMLRQ